MQNFIRDAVAAGVTGIGHGYMPVSTPNGITTTRRIHVGGGESAAWRDMRPRTDPLHQRPFAWVEAARVQGAAARDKMLKAGVWPDPTAPTKFMPRADLVSDFLDMAAAGGAQTLSRMRNLIEKDMLVHEIKKDAPPNWPEINRMKTRE
jgi:hypothetical protein